MNEHPVAGTVYEQQVPQEDLQLQNFLGNMAAGIPEIVVDNPFEPDPISMPSVTAAATEASYAFAVAQLFEDLQEHSSAEGGVPNGANNLPHYGSLPPRSPPG